MYIHPRLIAGITGEKEIRIIRSVPFIFFLMVLMVLPLEAVIRTNWYDITISQEEWLASNTHNLSWGGANLYIGNIGLLRKANSNVTNYEPNLVIRYITPNNTVQLTNVGDPTKVFPCYLTQQLNGNTSGTYYVNSSPFSINAVANWYSGGNLYLNIPPMTGSDAGYEGTYTASFRIQVFALDYEPGQPVQYVLLKEEVLNIIVYYKYKTALPPGETVVTNLMLDRYASADGIDVAVLQATQGSLLVGAVTLITNDKDMSHTYTINIVPTDAAGFALPGGTFAFHQASGIYNPIPYKVFANGRTTPSATAFSVNPPGKGPADFWQDWLEIGISALNFSNVPLVAGNYSSTIRIELTTNY